MYGKSIATLYTVYTCMENLLLHHKPSIGLHVWKIYCYSLYCVYMYGKPIATPYTIYAWKTYRYTIFLVYMYGKAIATPNTVYTSMENLLLHHIHSIHDWKIY